MSFTSHIQYQTETENCHAAFIRSVGRCAHMAGETDTHHRVMPSYLLCHWMGSPFGTCCRQPWVRLEL